MLLMMPLAHVLFFFFSDHLYESLRYCNIKVEKNWTKENRRGADSGSRTITLWKPSSVCVSVLVKESKRAI